MAKSPKYAPKTKIFERLVDQLKTQVRPPIKNPTSVNGLNFHLNVNHYEKTALSSLLSQERYAAFANKRTDQI